ncbi:MAG: hypothetical protein MZV49_12025 [Rhodopseudomonas palustris]|nr:hypothetical protein [Rhodopseudomonas palustris]
MTAQTLLTRAAARRPPTAAEPPLPVAAPPVRCADTGLYMRIVPLKAYDNPNGRERWHNLAGTRAGAERVLRTGIRNSRDDSVRR